MTKKQRVNEIIKRLEIAYPEVKCGLVTVEPWQLLVSVRLSAQCTDKRVNEVTKVFFKVYPTPEAVAASSPEEIEKIVYTCGLGATKSRDIFLAINKLLQDFKGKVPSTMEELLTIPGVGRKSANLILGEVFGLPSIVVDTHCIRLSNRLGLSVSNNPTVIENELRLLIPKNKSTNFCHRLISFGREICTSRNPKCEICFMSDICKAYSLDTQV